MLAWSSAFIRVKGGVPKVLWVHALLMNLKPKGRIKANQKGKTSGQMVSFLSEPEISKTKETSGVG